MKTTLLFLSVAILSISCKKESSQTEPSVVLSEHEWYPYSAEIITVDTTVVTSHDSTGIYHHQTIVSRFDTSFILNTCLQNSTFKFRSSGILSISNPCNSQTSAKDTLWSIAQNNFLTTLSINDTATTNYYSRFFGKFLGFVGPTDTSYNYILTRGAITKIDNSQFVFNNGLTELTLDVAGVNRDTLYKIASREYTTYRSR
jgi:hypothetical protein